MEPVLARLAGLYGIEPGYHDIWGQWRATPEATQRRLLAALGVEVGDDAAAEAALAAAERARWERVVPAITVLRRAGLDRGMRIQLPEAALARALSWRIVEEGGEVREERFDTLGLVRIEDHAHGDLRATAFRLPLPGDLPDGYHRIAIVAGPTVLGEGQLAVAPARCYLPAAVADGARVWGTTVQLYGLRSSRNAGVGDFTDLRHCAEVWGERGAAIVGTNPLHALSLRDPGHASPYSPSSRLFLNPIYIDVEAIDDFAEIAAGDPGFTARWRSQCEKLREGDIIDYAAVAAAKRAVFETLYAHFCRRHLEAGSTRARLYAQFRAVRGRALRHHALHEALAEVHGAPWRQWPEEHRDPSGEAVRRFARENALAVGLHEYLQWQADLQLARAQERCSDLGMAVGLYADLAISIGPDGSEAWANQHLYVLGASVGAPPDAFNTRGQDWGLPPLDPWRLREAAYAPLVATLRSNMLRAGALRIDHVMGLARLWWVPAGCEAGEGAYVRYPLEDLLGIVALESHRERCVVIGEDLGTVTDELRRELESNEILSYRLVLFEREGAEYKPPPAYPRRALVAWSTHDLPTFAGWWNGTDLATRGSLGLMDGAQLERARGERQVERAALVAALRREGLVADGTDPGGPFTDELTVAVHAFAARSPAAVMVVQMEDVLGVAEQANVPGTVEQHPNWRRRLPLAVDAWPRDARLRRMTRALAAIRGKTRARRERPAGLERARIPLATYRLQLHGEFTFRDATALVPYLAKLGVSHVYCSPFLRARPGSTHGYDIIDHETLNPEIGTQADLDAFVSGLRAHGMAIVMDIVPNHMGVLAADNAWWQDLLENGPASTLADFFDIDWRPPAEHLANRVLLPILGDHYGVELAAGHLVLGFDAESGAFAVHYHAHRLPLDPREYPRVLAIAMRELQSAPCHGSSQGEHQAQALASITGALAKLPRRDERRRGQVDERTLQKEILKGRLASLARSSPGVARAIAAAVESLNGRADDPASFDALHELLEAQAYRVAYWRVAADDINYRRFFDINDLAALRQEHGAVFAATHQLVLKLVNDGTVEALRVDHPDGLYDPKAYFARLFESCRRPPYLVVEKIVAPFENLPESWAVHGTTGYRFANVVNGLFVDPAAETRLTRTYHQFIGDETPYHEVTRRARRLVLRTALASELTVLTSRLARIARADRNTRDFTFNTLREGLAEVLAQFPVYRTYIDDQVHPDDRRYIDWACARARAESRAPDADVFDFIREALTCELPTRSPALAAAVRHFARKFQQLSAPVMAKGVEDTAFYLYNRLVSLNDVGGDPMEFGFPPAKFHRASAHRAKHWAHTMLATSTHDNKRSEDVRCRIDTLTELAAAWRLRLRRWHRMNLGRKATIEDAPAPSRNDEYLLYQVLLGSFPPGPLDEAALAAYRARIVAYMQKACREAKARTSWARVNEPYEAATTAFIEALLDPRPGNAFLDDFRAALEPIAWAGYLNSLALVAVKYTSPGVPDCYQGNELIDLSLVDPDNRRPVDYARRQALLDEIARLPERPDDAALRDLFADARVGRGKLYVTWRLLQLRRAREALFKAGTYTALRVVGEKARHAVAFARRHGREASITVVPRLVASLGMAPGRLPCGGEAWGDTRVEIPFVAADATLRDAITQRERRLAGGGIALAELFDAVPVAVLAA
jgi:(1->4)-alpha-D-glucan 1-alpha-D-glucosylmutase